MANRKLSKEEYAKFRADHFAETAAELRKSSVLNRVEEALSALDYSVLAMERLAKHMASLDPAEAQPCEACGRKGISIEQAGKTHAYMAKVVNEVTRLLQFERGKPDSRQEVVGLADLMKVLTEEQFETLNKWYEEGMQRDGPLETTPTGRPH